MIIKLTQDGKQVGTAEVEHHRPFYERVHPDDAKPETPESGPVEVGAKGVRVQRFNRVEETDVYELEPQE